MIENLLKTIKKGIAGTALGLTALFNPLSGCGQECDIIIEQLETIAGSYNGITEAVYSDPPDFVPEEMKTMEIRVPVIPLNTEESRIEAGIYEFHPYTLEFDGVIYDKWESGNSVYEVHGVFTEDNRFNANTSVLGRFPDTDVFYYIEWDIKTTKQTEDPIE